MNVRCLLDDGTIEDFSSADSGGEDESDTDNPEET